MHHRTVFEAKAAHLLRCGPSTRFWAVVTRWNGALFDRPHKHVVTPSHAFHYTAPSLVSSVGSVGLGSALEASGAGSAFGVTPSTSRRPSGQTMWRSKTTFTPEPPSDSEAEAAASVWATSLPKIDVYALQFSRPSATR